MAPKGTRGPKRAPAYYRVDDRRIQLAPALLQQEREDGGSFPEH
jgi:hypothetical protein